MSGFMSDRGAPAAPAPAPPAPVCGGIDLGGTKIEAKLFDANLEVIVEQRRTTPRDTYENLRQALADEIDWLRQAADDPHLAVGIAVPGLVDPMTGIAITSNLPATGHRLGHDLQTPAGGQVLTANDCKCFVLSEANGGAGAGHDRVFGLVLGTGVGGGFCRGGALDLGFNGLVGEVGHGPLPAHLIVEHDLPMMPCGCGRTGCVETYISGTGLTNLARVLFGTEQSAEVIAANAAAGDQDMQRVLLIWAQLTGELLHNIQLHLDPDCVVLGGGLSNIALVETMLRSALTDAALPSVRLPKITTPVFGDSSGARGAALLVLQQPNYRT